MKTIVVTGATSIIGSSLIRACLRQDIQRIYAVVRPGCGKLSRLPKDDRLRILECPIDQYDTLPQKIHGPCDVFYHIAWSLTGAARNSDLSEQARNILYTLNAVNAAKALGCGKFVGAGSQAEYGKSDAEKIGPETPVNPVQAYGIAKYAAGKLAMQAAARLELSCLWVRIFSVYGIFDKPTSMISTALPKMLSGERASFSAGDQIWDYLFSEDAGEAFRLIGERAQGRKVYCLGSGQARPLKTFLTEMRDTVHPALELGLGDIPYTDSTVMRLCADISSLQADTGFRPETSFSEGIRNTIRWMLGETELGEIV